MLSAMGDGLIGVLVTSVALSLLMLSARVGNSEDGATVSADRRIVTLHSGQYALIPVPLDAERARLRCCESIDDM
ncbi:hypothetical protein GCM10007159_03850 [Modicisalibacter luteus]|nr:hypothetical protein GCM10007159_03850 [Halomonas lutea]